MSGGRFERARGEDGIHRRDFLKVCTLAAASLGLPASVAVRWAEAAAVALKPSVIWLHFQECTGCTETLLRTSHPALAELILDLVSLDYHETLFAAAGHQIEAALQQAMAANAGKYVCVVEGSIPLADGGIYCQIGGRTAVDILQDVGGKAAAIVALGSCSSFGGLAAAEPNPTGAVGVGGVIKDKPVVTLPGCPANPYNFLGTVLQYVTYGTLPALDELGRPRFAYGRTIHEDCPRRPHFDAGRFANAFGDEGHREGHCLYKVGCKGPSTHANCSLQHFGEVPGAWPIGVGHPCCGCTEQKLLWRSAIHDTVEIEHPLPGAAFPPVEPERRGGGAVAAGIAGVVGGAIVGAGLLTAKKLGKGDEKEG